MAFFTRSRPLILPVAPVAASVIGVLTAAMFALVPTDILESMVVDSGIAAVLSAAEPPLGLTARLLLVLVCGGVVGMIAWFALFLVFGARTMVVQRGRSSSAAAPILRRADAHPDAPARRPLFANTDLGTPFLDVRARATQTVPEPETDESEERPLPDDLDQPLAAYDPKAMKVTAAPDAGAPLAVDAAAPLPIGRPQTFDPTERFEIFPLTPMVRPTVALEPQAEQTTAPIFKPDPALPAAHPSAAGQADPSETIHALLDRLERVVSHRTQPPPPPQESIEDTLAALRQLATGAR